MLFVRCASVSSLINFEENQGQTPINALKQIKKIHKQEKLGPENVTPAQLQLLGSLAILLLGLCEHFLMQGGKSCQNTIDLQK